ncbi:MAG: peptidoglycan-binding protein [Candidatus Pacebacteria bacterium]|nr:peptidoglycan-binding protein [Candidatus Paceibacterota bacterium]
MTTGAYKKLFAFVFGLFFILSPNTAQAQTFNSNLLAQIESLLQTVLELQNKLIKIEGGDATANSLHESINQLNIQSENVICRGINITLWRGIQNKEVSDLQTYLRSTGDYIYPEITGYYGRVTESAVKLWQSRNNVVTSGTPESTGFGVFGPASQAKVKSLCQKSNSLATVTTTQTKCVQYYNPVCSVGTISLSAGLDYQGCLLPRRCVSTSSGSEYFKGIQSGGIARTLRAPVSNRGREVSSVGKNTCRDFEYYDSRIGLCRANNGVIGSNPTESSDSYVQTFDHKGVYEDDESPFVVYSVRNGDFALVQEAYNLTQSERTLAENMLQHRAIWDLIKLIFGNVTVFDGVVEFSIFSDGNGGTFAYVAKAIEDIRNWALAVDPADIIQSDGHEFLDLEDFLETLLHEFTHVFTLDGAQLNPYATESECTSTYFAGEDYGCSNKNSYMNTFYKRFWEGALYDEYQYAVGTCQGETCLDTEYDFYARHEEKFVSPFAFRGPEEDIAESFTYFVLAEKPENNSIWERKLLFFYEFPEMVSLRQELQRGLLKVHETISR